MNIHDVIAMQHLQGQDSQGSVHLDALSSGYTLRSATREHSETLRATATFIIASLVSGASAASPLPSGIRPYPDMFTIAFACYANDEAVPMSKSALLMVLYAAGRASLTCTLSRITHGL